MGAKPNKETLERPPESPKPSEENVFETTPSIDLPSNIDSPRTDRINSYRAESKLRDPHTGHPIEFSWIHQNNNDTHKLRQTHPSHHHHHSHFHPHHHHHHHQQHHQFHPRQPHNLINDGHLAERFIAIKRWDNKSPELTNQKTDRSFYDEYIRAK